MVIQGKQMAVLYYLETCTKAQNRKQKADVQRELVVTEVSSICIPSSCLYSTITRSKSFISALLSDHHMMLSTAYIGNKPIIIHKYINDELHFWSMNSKIDRISLPLVHTKQCMCFIFFLNIVEQIFFPIFQIFKINITNISQVMTHFYISLLYPFIILLFVPRSGDKQKTPIFDQLYN